MSHRPDLDDPDLDGDSGIDGDPGADHAAYDEWAAIAGEPVPRAAASLEERTGHAAASFDAIAATLTETQVAAAAHHGSILVLAGAGTGKTSTLTAAVAHRVAVDGIPPHRVLAVTFTNKAASEMANRIRAALGPDSARLLARHIPRPGGPPASRFPRSRVPAGELRHPRRRRRPTHPSPRHEGAEPFDRRGRKRQARSGQNRRRPHRQVQRPADDAEGRRGACREPDRRGEPHQDSDRRRRTFGGRPRVRGISGSVEGSERRGLRRSSPLADARALP